MTTFICRQVLLAVLLLVLVVSPIVVQAEAQEIIAEGTYIMDDGETPDIAQERAIAAAKRLAVEQARVYLESSTEVENMKLTRDEVRLIAVGVVETTVIDKRREILGANAIKFWVKVRCIVHTETLQAMRDRLQDRMELEKLKKVQENYDRLMRQQDELKMRLAQAVNSEARKQMQLELVRNEQEFTAVQWLEKGHDYLNRQEYDKAIAAYSQAIALNPKYADALCNRGVVYGLKGQDDLAVVDYGLAIAMNPRYELAYFNRANTYARNDRSDLAFADYNRAIALNPQNAEAYNGRGAAYGDNGQYNQAIADYDRAIALDPKYVIAYFNKALTCDDDGRWEEAIAAYRHFIVLAPVRYQEQIAKAKKRLLALGG